MDVMEALSETTTRIRSEYPHPIQVAAILGSGLGDLAEQFMPGATCMPYDLIPHFPHSTVEGHHGRLLLGEVRPGLHMACLQGRVHAYEGLPLSEVVYPLRALHQLGAQTLLVTNAAGGVNPAFNAGDLMLITDHINLMGTNPLIGKNPDALGPRFPDMSEAYTQSLRTLALKQAEQLGITLRQGVYCALTGPTYETPAEIRMIRSFGGDAVGMSTVPEVIAARHMNMQVLGISCITNPAAGVVEGHRLSHQEVLDAAEEAKTRFSRLISAILDTLPVSSAASV